VVTVRSGRVEGGHLILDDALPLPDGTPVRISVEVVESDDETPTPESTADFASEPFFGMWADRDDDMSTWPEFGMWADRPEMQDSVAWVRNQRARWRRLRRSED
jgi:hypothetical protein